MKEDNKYLTIETLFSIIIIIVIGIIIAFVCLKINEKTKASRFSSEASVIVTNIIENMNSRNYSEIDTYVDSLSYVGISKVLEENEQIITVSGDDFTDKFFGTEIPSGYIVELRIGKLDSDFDLQKNITINVQYEINNNIENFEISTVIQRESIEECNSPEINDTYFSDLGISLDDYDIVPIKYSYTDNSYVVTTEGDTDWYNYSAKEWAKVLVFSKYSEDLKDQFIDENGIVSSTIKYNNYYDLNIENYMYVWIPNFSIKDNISYFRYGSGKNSIKQDLLYSDGKYLYLNIISDEIDDISEDCSFNGITGVWKAITNSSDDIYIQNFNLTKYGPMNTHL